MKLPMRFLVRRAILVYAMLLLTAVGIGIALAQPPSITISIESAKFGGEGPKIGEVEKSVTVTVKLSAKCAETVTVEYATAPGTALADDDYKSNSGTLTFLPDEIEKTITVILVDDAIAESEEDFYVELSNPSSNASVDYYAWQCIVSIIDDDGSLPTVYFDAMDATVSEDVAKVPVTINVYLSAKAPTQVTVKYATKDWPLVNGATAGADYTAISGTVTFEIGETDKTITVDILPDYDAEFAESFSVELSDPTAATLGTRSLAMITIADHNNRGVGLIPVAVSTTGGPFYPDPASVDTWVDAVFKATATRPDTETSATIVPPPAWSWQVYEAKYSAVSDTGPWTDATGSGWMYLMTSYESTDGTSDFSEMAISASFPIGGYWEVKCTSEAIYTDTASVIYFGSGVANGNGKAVPLTIKSITVSDSGDTLDSFTLGPVLGKTKFAWGFKVVIEGIAGSDITKAKVLKQEMYMLVKKVPLEGANQYDIFTGQGKFKELTDAQFKAELKIYDSGKGTVTYASDKDKESILNTNNKLVKVDKNVVTYVDGPGYPDYGTGPALPAKDYATVELYMKFRVTARGTDDKEAVVEFFRYQIGFPDDGAWVIPPGTQYSGNTKLPLEKTP